MRKLNREKRSMILAALVEGNSVNSTARLCRVSKLTILRLLNDVGSLCRDYHDLVVHGLTTRRIQADECWSFCGCKEKSKRLGASGHGDVWVWVALDSDSKLAVSWLMGSRDASAAHDFVQDVASRLNHRIQLTTDGLTLYLNAVDAAFVGEIDYATLEKIYGKDKTVPEGRYSPPQCIGCKRLVEHGDPDPAHISTSHIERSHLSLRMGNRRFTRLTNAFSKKIENHAHALALYYFHYNFIRQHSTIKTTPAVKAGVTTKEWTLDDLVDLLESEEKALNSGGRINRADRT